MEKLDSKQSRLKILLIDDDKAFIEVVAMRLRDECHHETVTVTSAIDAMQKLDTMSAGVDVILLDYEMPDMNGMDFLKWMKANHKETPVIVLTAMSSDKLALEAIKLGAYDYMRKDVFDMNSLNHAIYATHERRLYHIEQEFEEERIRELGLDLQATDRVRDVLNTIAPSLHAAVANISYELEVKSGEMLAEIPPASRGKVKSLLEGVLKEVRVLETSIRGLLTLYRILYARHKEQREIDEISREMERDLKSNQDVQGT